MNFSHQLRAIDFRDEHMQSHHDFRALDCPYCRQCRMKRYCDTLRQRLPRHRLERELSAEPSAEPSPSPLSVVFPFSTRLLMRSFANGLQVKDLLRETVLVAKRSTVLTCCPICFGWAKKYEILRKIRKCGHTFHANCVDQWFVTSTTCPVCRHQLEES
mgnify:CR=1 FL=1